MSEKWVEQAEPFDRFEKAYGDAVDSGMTYPNAMAVSTVGHDGRPSARTVLLKGFDRRGFVFYTNFESRKGREILAEPRVCLHFYWRELERQVLVEGEARRVEDAEADAYFATRDRGSQLGAWASRQSRPLKGRAHLLAEVARFEAKFLGGAVPRPPHWSGFRVVPDRFEFWVSGLFRLHQRTVFERERDGWRRFQVFP